MRSTESSSRRGPSRRLANARIPRRSFFSSTTGQRKRWTYAGSKYPIENWRSTTCLACSQWSDTPASPALPAATSGGSLPRDAMPPRPPRPEGGVRREGGGGFRFRGGLEVDRRPHQHVKGGGEHREQHRRGAPQEPRPLQVIPRRRPAAESPGADVMRENPERHEQRQRGEAESEIRPFEPVAAAVAIEQ